MYCQSTFLSLPHFHFLPQYNIFKKSYPNMFHRLFASALRFFFFSVNKAWLEHLPQESSSMSLISHEHMSLEAHSAWPTGNIQYSCSNEGYFLLAHNSKHHNPDQTSAMMKSWIIWIIKKKKKQTHTQSVYFHISVWKWIRLFFTPLKSR